MKNKLMAALVIALGLLSIPICGGDATAAVILLVIGICGFLTKGEKAA